MIDAKWLATGATGDPTVDVWGVWIPRRGDNLLFHVEVVSNYGTNFDVELFEKNYDEVGDGADALVGTGFEEATGRQSFTKLGAKELVRVRLTLQRGASLPAGDVGLVLFRFLEPVWFETVKV